MKFHLPRLCAIVLGGILLTAAYHRTQSAPVMADAANRFLHSLTPEQRAKATFAFGHEQRFNYHYVPIERTGLPLHEMTSHQKHLASALLSAGLSQHGFIKAVTIMSLEDVLRVMEKDSGERRNPEKYYFSIFGEPSEKGAWGYKVEGHHLSQNYTVVNGAVVDAPSFFGSNPAEVREGPRKGLRVLAAEEDLGRDLLLSLDAAQRKSAIVDATAYKDILTAQNRVAALDGQPSGLPGAKLSAAQFAKLAALVDEYTKNVPEQMAAHREALVKKAGKNLHFAWSGVVEKGGPHYYRVQAATFLIEYDNTQNNANHIHSVWREFGNDFGLDLLKAHYQASH